MAEEVLVKKRGRPRKVPVTDTPSTITATPATETVATAATVKTTTRAKSTKAAAAPKTAKVAKAAPAKSASKATGKTATAKTTTTKSKTIKSTAAKSGKEISSEGASAITATAASAIADEVAIEHQVLATKENAAEKTRSTGHVAPELKPEATETFNSASLEPIVKTLPAKVTSSPIETATKFGAGSKLENSKILEQVRELEKNKTTTAVSGTVQIKPATTIPSRAGTILQAKVSAPSNIKPTPTSHTSIPHPSVPEYVTPPRRAPVGPTPTPFGTEMPQKYKGAYNRVLVALVAAPLAIFTSYVLFDRLVLGNERKSLAKYKQKQPEQVLGENNSI